MAAGQQQSGAPYRERIAPITVTPVSESDELRTRPPQSSPHIHHVSTVAWFKADDYKFVIHAIRRAARNLLMGLTITDA
jgi:hypothetical protein